MSRLVARLGVVLCALCLTAGASAAGPRPVPAAGHTASGAVTAVGYDSITVMTNGRRLGVANAMIAAASTITREDYPYVWGGGHAVAGTASAGEPGGPGYNGRRKGFDCSGSVAAVLEAGGLWPAGGGVPSDLGVIDELRAQGLIAPGPGRTANEVTLYDDPGVHIFMNIDGRFFGTSDGAGGGSRKGGPGWLDDGAPDAHTRIFRQYHVVPGLLHDKTTYGHTYTLQVSDPAELAAVAVGDHVRVGFRPGPVGTLTLTALSWIGARTVTGTVSALSGQTFAVVAAGGQTLTFSAPAATLTQSLAIGDQIEVTYTAHAQALTARVLTVTAQPTAQTAAGSVTAVAADGSSLTVTPATGPALTFSTGGQPDLVSGLSVGDQVQVTYVAVGPALIAQSVTTDGASPAPPPAPAAAQGAPRHRWH